MILPKQKSRLGTASNKITGGGGVFKVLENRSNVYSVKIKTVIEQTFLTSKEYLRI